MVRPWCDGVFRFLAGVGGVVVRGCAGLKDRLDELYVGSERVVGWAAYSVGVKELPTVARTSIEKIVVDYSPSDLAYARFKAYDILSSFSCELASFRLCATSIYHVALPRDRLSK